MKDFLIHDDADLARAIDLIAQLWEAAPGSAGGQLLHLMGARVDAYEAAARARVFPPADPRAVIASKLRELRWTQRELTRRLGWGSTGRVSEVLSGKRALTLAMVRELSAVLGIEPGILVADTPAEVGDTVWVRLPRGLVERVTQAGCLGHSSVETCVSEVLRRELDTPRTSLTWVTPTVATFVPSAQPGPFATMVAA